MLFYDRLPQHQEHLQQPQQVERPNSPSGEKIALLAARAAHTVSSF